MEQEVLSRYDLRDELDELRRTHLELKKAVLDWMKAKDSYIPSEQHKADLRLFNFMMGVRVIE